MSKERIVILGSGPAGLTAALYAARADLEPVVISGTQLGGQVSITYEVENYPGFPEGSTGPELVERMQKQAERFGARVGVCHRRGALRAGETLKRRALANDKMSFVWDTVVEEIVGNGKVEGVRLRNLKTGAVERTPPDGVFIYIGHFPNTDLFRGQLAMDDHGYLQTDARMMTSVEGIFAAGEVQDPVYRQVATSVGQGAAAGMMLERWLASRE